MTTQQRKPVDFLCPLECRARGAVLRNALWGVVVAVLGCGGTQESDQKPNDKDNTAPRPSQSSCQGIHCGECPPAVKVLLIDPDTGREIGWDAVVPAASVVGENGVCNTFGECTLPPKDNSVATEYNFDIVFQGEVVQSISTTAAEEEAAECCSCGYATRLIRLEVDV